MWLVVGYRVHSTIHILLSAIIIISKRRNWVCPNLRIRIFLFSITRLKICIWFGFVDHAISSLLIIWPWNLNPWMRRYRGNKIRIWSYSSRETRMPRVSCHFSKCVKMKCEDPYTYNSSHLFYIIDLFSRTDFTNS